MVANLKSDLQKLKMADPIWRITTTKGHSILETRDFHENFKVSYTSVRQPQFWPGGGLTKKAPYIKNLNFSNAFNTNNINCDSLYYVKKTQHCKIETKKRKYRKIIKNLINSNIWVVNVGAPNIRITTTDGKKEEN